jgi:hypothetical protein
MENKKYTILLNVVGPRSFGAEVRKGIVVDAVSQVEACNKARGEFRAMGWTVCELYKILEGDLL